MSLKFIITSDLHQQTEKWGRLVDVVKAERPRFVLITGDLLPKEGGFAGQRLFFTEMRRHFMAMKAGGPVTVITFFGNDDAHVLEPLLDKLAGDGLCVNLNGRVHREEGLVFCGMTKVRDYPFGYKHWCARDGEYQACPEQFCGQGLTLDKDGRFIRLDNLSEYLSGKPAIGDEIAQLKAMLRDGEMSRSIWMVHQPPAELGMDICADGRRVGSPTILQFIRDDQPLLGCSGHIHESPHQRGGSWSRRVGRTVWLQPGQIGDRLHCVGLEVTRNLTVENIRHSIFGLIDR